LYTVEEENTADTEAKEFIGYRRQAGFSDTITKDHVIQAYGMIP